MEPTVCDVPPPDRGRSEDKIRAFLAEKAPGLADLYDAARIARHYPHLPGVSLLVSHLVREIGNGLTSIQLGPTSKTEERLQLERIADAWDGLNSILNSYEAQISGTPDEKPFSSARRNITEAVQAFRQSREAGRLRAARLFEELTGLPPTEADPTPQSWFRNLKASVGDAHFQSQHGEMPELQTCLNRLDRLEEHMRSIVAGQAEALDAVNDLLKEAERET